MNRNHLLALVAAVAVLVLMGWWLRPLPEDVPVSPVAASTPIAPPPSYRPRTTPELIARTQDAARTEPEPTTDRPEPVEPVAAADTAEPLADEVVLTVEVIDTDGYRVEGADLFLGGDCGRRRFPLPRGEVQLTLPTGLCTVSATRPDGALRAFSETVEFDGAPGDAFDIILAVPAERTGGIGVQFRPDDDGMRVTLVVPGSPADAAGLRVGDVITEVDGTPANTLSLRGFVQTMTGPEGSDVDFRVRYTESEGETVEDAVVVTRAFLEG